MPEDFLTHYPVCFLSAPNPFDIDVVCSHALTEIWSGIEELRASPTIHMCQEIPNHWLFRRQPYFGIFFKCRICVCSRLEVCCNYLTNSFEL